MPVPYCGISDPFTPMDNFEYLERQINIDQIRARMRVDFLKPHQLFSLSFSCVLSFQKSHFFSESAYREGMAGVVASVTIIILFFGQRAHIIFHA